MPDTHALLSPSSAMRWLNCTASPRLEVMFPEETSAFAEEGTLAHAYCARGLKKYIKQVTIGEDYEINSLKQYHTGEMDEYTQEYIDTVTAQLEKARKKTKDAQLFVEVRLDFSKYIPESFGTSDAVIINDGTMEVVDFKYGKGVKVNAENNPQMMIYALGAYERFSFEYDIKDISMTIIQPRIGNYSTFTISVKDILKWSEVTLVPKSKEAFSDNGIQKAGDWCRFCKARHTCVALAKYSICTIADAGNKLLTTDDMSKLVLPRLEVMKKWISDIETYTLEQALKGVKYYGFKLVEGRSNRKIVDSDAVRALLNTNGYEQSDYMKPSELRSITDLEKLIGKKKFSELCGNYIDKPQGKPVLVNKDDKRAEWNSTEMDFKDVEM